MTETYLDYAGTSPATWTERLQEARGSGALFVDVPVYWGAHEQLRGIREFSKPPRLRLERFLSAAQEQGLGVRLHLGFFPGPTLFPQWTFGVNRWGLIPESCWEPGNPALGLVKVPSLHDEEVRDAFLSFLQEVNGIVRLYRSPEGPVRSVTLRLDLFGADLNAADAPEFPETLAERYGDIRDLNRRYHTAFKDFASVGWRTLGEKRPWLAAYDYKWCRARLLERLAESYRARLKGFLDEIRLEPPEGTIGSPEVWFDAVMLEGTFPCFPGGWVNGPGALAFRTWEGLAREGLPVGRLEGGTRPPGPLATVICGTYLARSVWTSLVGAAREGTGLFFPMGLPKYDETLKALEIPGERETGRTNEGELHRLREGKGALWVPAQPLAPGRGLGERLRRWTREIGE